MNVSDAEFQEIRLLVQSLCGIWLGNDKKYLVQARLEPIVSHHRLTSYQALVQLASQSMQVQESIVEAIATNETSFYRDGHPFDEFRRSILPELIELRAQRQRITGLPFGKLRIWSAAASTGQEAYSIGMSICDYIDSQASEPMGRLAVTPDNFSIFGTDISTRAIRIAKEASYHGWELDRGLPIEWRQKYFEERNGTYFVRLAIRNLVEFRRLNLIQSFADISGIDLILCRNLLIYFDEPTRKKVLEQLVRSLAPGGMLMLGSAESITILPRGIQQRTYGRTIVYRKQTTA